MDMAKTKTKMNGTASASKKQTGSDKGAAAAAPLTRADAVLVALTSKWDTLTNEDRAVLAAKYSDKQCEAKGAETKSEGVLSDALGWVAIIDKELPKYPVELRRYSKARFAWLLECVRKLADERALQKTKGGAAGVLKVAVDQAVTKALAARREVVDSLEELVEGDGIAETALSGALGSTDRPDRIVASIGTLCAYARQWLGQTDAGAKKRVELAGLTLAEVETAETAAATLAQATAGKTLEGAAIVRDSPAVNQIEGRVLLEMRAVMRVFNKANALNKKIPKLVPGKATRSVLARSGSAVAEEADETPEPGAPQADPVKKQPA